jgi:hypothetical protein
MIWVDIFRSLPKLIDILNWTIKPLSTKWLLFICIKPVYHNLVGLIDGKLFSQLIFKICVFILFQLIFQIKGFF